MSSAGTLYKGALRSKRKNELLDIANALGLSIDEEGAKRDDVENMVKSHLLDNRAALHSHPAWAGLYHSIDQSDKRAARSSSTAMSPDSDVSDEGNSGRSPRKHTQKAKSLANGLGTPLRKSSNAATAAVEGASNFTSAIQASTRRSLENLSSVFKSGASEIRDEVRDEISDATAEVNSFWLKLRRSARLNIRRAEDHASRGLRRSRAYLSDSTNLTALLIILEASMLVTNVMPTSTVEVGNRSIKNLVKSGGKSASGTIPHLSLTVPNLWALLSFAFWRPIVLWSVWTVAIPLVAAHLITFDRKHEPSAVTFAIARLALLSTLTRSAFGTSRPIPQVVGVAAGEIRKASASLFGSVQNQARAMVSYDFVAPFVSPELQLLLTTLAAAFATYELIANRPRASALA